eukprot:213570_1
MSTAQDISLYGATSPHDHATSTEAYALISPYIKPVPTLKPVHENKVVISNRTNSEDWVEGISLFSVDQIRNDVLHSNKNEQNFSSIPMAIFNMTAGCGIVGLPIQYLKAGGIVPGLFITITVSLLSVYTMRLLVYTGIRCRCKDYERLVSECFGIAGYYLISFLILLFGTGSCFVYTIILGNCAQDVLEYIFNLRAGTDRNRQIFVILVYILIILPLCMRHSFRFIEKMQIVGIGIFILLVCAVAYIWWDEYQYIDNVPFYWFNEDERQFQDWMEFIGAFSAITFGLIQHDVSFFVFKTLKRPTYRKYSILSIVGMTIQCILCISLCIFGYISFGEDMKDDILRNYATDRYAVIMVIRICYIVRMTFIFPTAFYVVRHILFAIIYRGYDTYEFTTFNKKIIFTIFPLMFFLIVGLYLKNLGHIMTLFGLLSAINIGFVVPCLCYLKYGTKYSIVWGKAKPGKFGNAIFDTLPSMILISFGIVISIFGSVEFIYFQITSKWLGF